MAEHNIQQLNRFKIERENTIQFPLGKMLKDSISESILSDIQNVNVKLWKELSCISKVSNKDDVKRLKHFMAPHGRGCTGALPAGMAAGV